MYNTVFDVNNAKKSTPYCVVLRSEVTFYQQCGKMADRGLAV